MTHAGISFLVCLSAHHKLYIKNSIIVIEKCSRSNGKMVIPRRVGDALGVELGSSGRCEIDRVKT
jgi:hypothetical protein